MPLPVLFFDDGGVMNDNRVRGPQWQRLVGELFAPLLGGTLEAWADANRQVLDAMLTPAEWQTRLDASPDYVDFDYRYQLDWMQRMCALVGVPAPPDERCAALGRQASHVITRRVRSAFPGAVEAIRTLHARGYTLHTASGEASDVLDGYLAGMGVRDCFVRLYGPDLINTHKGRPEYYTRLLADAQVAPAQAIFVDDSPLVIPWVAAAGARLALVRTGPVAGQQPWRQITRLAALPDLLREESGEHSA